VAAVFDFNMGLFGQHWKQRPRPLAVRRSATAFLEINADYVRQLSAVARMPQSASLSRDPLRL
jgi:hypothetical protein